MKGILIAATVESVRTRKDHTLSVTIGTQEMSPAEGGNLLSMVNKLGVVYICDKGISQEEINKVDKVDPEFGGKTQSERLRNVLYKLFEQEAEGYKTFDEYYHAKTEAWITKLKTKIK